jgi:H+/Cl- antiporter ClcA
MDATIPEAGKAKKAKTLNMIALICAVWFLPMGSFWTYLGNLIVGYPVGIIGWVLWRNARKLDADSKLNKVVMWLLVAGLVCSVVSFFLFYFWG